MNIRVNIEYKRINKNNWRDVGKRSEHLIDRMQLRGISVENIKEAIIKGAKKLRKDGSIISEFRWFKVIYREFYVEDFRKIYPITVIDI